MLPIKHAHIRLSPTLAHHGQPISCYWGFAHQHNSGPTALTMWDSSQWSCVGSFWDWDLDLDGLALAHTTQKLLVKGKSGHVYWVHHHDGEHVSYC